MSYGIRPDYVHREEPSYFIDNPLDGMVWQPDVYALAEFIAETTHRYCLYDVGCGCGAKLLDIARRHPKWTYYGCDHGPNLQIAANTCGTHVVLRDIDLDRPHRDATNPASPLPYRAVIIAADVIEHLVDPTALVRMLRRSESSTILLSTPVRAADDIGWPANPAHVREWTMPELRGWLTQEGLDVRWQGLTRSSTRGGYGTQLLVCSAA